MRRFLFFAFLAVGFISPSWPFGPGVIALAAPSCSMTGQVHPRFDAVVAINGETLKTVRPENGQTAVFLTQLKAGLLHSGNNVIRVDYTVGPALRVETLGPSFKIRIECQDRSTDTDSAKFLSEIGGPNRPFPGDGFVGFVELQFPVSDKF